MKAPIAVTAWSLATGEPLSFQSMLAANDEGGFCRENIRRSLDNMRRQHGGYIWLKQNVKPCDVCVFNKSRRDK